MGESDWMMEDTLEDKEEELCKALSTFSITLKDFSAKRPLTTMC